MRIAPATTAAEIESVRGLFRTYADGLGIDLGYQGFAEELAGLPGAYGPPGGALLLARDAAGAPVGCVALRPIDPPGCCEMKRLFLLPAARGTGLGRALAQAAMEEARRRGYREMRLDSLPFMAAAVALYRALGFREIAPYYPTPVEGTVFMACDL